MIKCICPKSLCTPRQHSRFQSTAANQFWDLVETKHRIAASDASRLDCRCWKNSSKARAQYQTFFGHLVWRHAQVEAIDSMCDKNQLFLNKRTKQKKWKEKKWSYLIKKVNFHWMIRSKKVSFGPCAWNISPMINVGTLIICWPCFSSFLK